MILESVMIFWFLLLGSALSAPSDEFNELLNNGIDFSQKSAISNIVPGTPVLADIKSRYSTTNSDKWSDLVKFNSVSDYLNIFNKYVEKGVTGKDLTFSIYDNDMREAAIALFRLFQNTDGETFIKIREWTKKNINTEMYMYTLRLESLHGSKVNSSTLLPPFIWNPHHFVNAESLSQASNVAYDIASNPEIFNVASKRDSNKPRDLIFVVNTNYSGWNLHKNQGDDLLDYFREDISLNSYYFGIHLLNPFWMTHEELNDKNPKFAEKYLYLHQQLLARYNLEKLHLEIENSSHVFSNWNYVSYLRYKNGLLFPTRPCELKNDNYLKDFLKTIDLIMDEIFGGLMNKYSTSKNEETRIETNRLAKLMRDNLDGNTYLRFLIGYGTNAEPTSEYNSTPSILHQPETSLRDPAYWFIIQRMLNKIIDYKNTEEPFDVNQYETKELEIVNVDISKLTTFFDYYQYPVNHALSNFVKNENDWMDFLEVRQRRLNHVKFSLKLTVKTKINTDIIVRLYFGPGCDNNNCWNQYSAFFELDTFIYTIKQGENVISWSPETSGKFSFDDYYNSVLRQSTPASKYSMFRFPDNLLIPRGLQQGLNLTLFVMITPSDDVKINYSRKNIYRDDLTVADSKPLGFPFHRKATGFKDTAYNYKFYNITIYHRHQSVDFRGYFSPHLY